MYDKFMQALYNGEEHVSVSASDLDALNPNIALQRTTAQQGVPIADGGGELTEVRNNTDVTLDVTLLGGWLDHKERSGRAAREIPFKASFTARIMKKSAGFSSVTK